MVNNSTDGQALAETTKIAFSASLCVIAFINLTGNSIVINIIIRNKLTKSPMNYLLLNLALADILVGTFLPMRFIFTYFVTHPEDTTGAIICRLFTGGPPAWIGGMASILFLVAISFERYCAVVHPFSRKLKLNWLKVKYITAIAWVFAVVFNSPYFFLIDFDKENNFCYEVWPEGYLWMAQGYSTLWFLFGALFPAVIMITLYSKVIYRLWIKPRKFHIQFSHAGVMKLRRKATKMVLIVSAIYCVSWMPNLTLYFLYYIIDNVYAFSDHYYIISNILVTFNSAVNPFIYGFQSKHFREKLKQLFCKNQVHPPPRPSLPPPRKDSRCAFTLDINNL